MKMNSISSPWIQVIQLMDNNLKNNQRNIELIKKKMMKKMMRRRMRRRMRSMKTRMRIMKRMTILQLHGVLLVIVGDRGSFTGETTGRVDFFFTLLDPKFPRSSKVFEHVGIGHVSKIGLFSWTCGFWSLVISLLPY